MSKDKLAPKKIIAAIILAAILAVIIFLTIRFVHHRMVYAVTDAVFVRTDSLVDIGFNRVNGRVQTLSKREGNSVQKGETLAELDDTVYRLAKAQLAARLASTRNERQAKVIAIKRLRREIKVNKEIASSQMVEITKQKEVLKAQIAGVDADISQLQRDSDRYKKLLLTKAVSDSQAEDFATRLQVKQLAKEAMQKQVAALDASVITAKHQIELTVVEKLRIKEAEKALAQLDERIKELTAALASAHDDLDQCTLKSPLTGRVAKRYISPGAMVSPQRVVFSLVDPNDIYIIVLMEEKKLNGVLPGASANITIDAYPDEKYLGEVEAVLPTSAATFALAPRDISAGEFTKVAQRIPVRIRIIKGDKSLLRVGMGGEVEIKRQEKGDADNERRK